MVWFRLRLFVEERALRVVSRAIDSLLEVPKIRLSM